MNIGVIGAGAFGSAITHVLTENGNAVTNVDEGDLFVDVQDVVFVVVPSKFVRVALEAQRPGIGENTVLVSCVKGIEPGTHLFASEITKEVYPNNTYAVLSGPSFASELKTNVPTMVNVGSETESVESLLDGLLTNSWFGVEHVGTVLELELAGAMKNVYALAAGYVAGSGGGKNTHAHLQVVALREFTTLVHALEGNNDVVRPGVIGDLILTCASPESRNYRYGEALAGGERLEVTAEGAASVGSLLARASAVGVSLPLAQAVADVVEGNTTTSLDIMLALGFNKIV